MNPSTRKLQCLTLYYITLYYIILYHNFVLLKTPSMPSQLHTFNTSKSILSPFWNSQPSNSKNSQNSSSSHTECPPVPPSVHRIGKVQPSMILHQINERIQRTQQRKHGAFIFTIYLQYIRNANIKWPLIFLNAFKCF